MSYHGYVLTNADGTNNIINENEKYIVPTDKCMWKYPTDVPNVVKTRSKAKKESTVGYEEVDKYFATKYFIYQWAMGKEGRFFVQ